MATLTQTILSGILGLGWLTTLTARMKDRSEQRQKIMDYLARRRVEAKAAGRMPHAPDDIDDEKLRNLLAFLEPIGTYLAYNPATFKGAYGYFADEVLLCANSNLLWDASDRYEKSVYWRSFARFVVSTKKATGRSA